MRAAGFLFRRDHFGPYVRIEVVLAAMMALDGLAGALRGHGGIVAALFGLGCLAALRWTPGPFMCGWPHLAAGGGAAAFLALWWLPWWWEAAGLIGIVAGWVAAWVLAMLVGASADRVCGPAVTGARVLALSAFGTTGPDRAVRVTEGRWWGVATVSLPTDVLLVDGHSVRVVPGDRYVWPLSVETMAPDPAHL